MNKYCLDATGDLPFEDQEFDYVFQAGYREIKEYTIGSESVKKLPEDHFLRVTLEKLVKA